MLLLAMIRREWIHAVMRMPGRLIISRPEDAVNGRRYAGSEYKKQSPQKGTLRLRSGQAPDHEGKSWLQQGLTP